VLSMNYLMIKGYSFNASNSTEHGIRSVAIRASIKSLDTPSFYLGARLCYR